MSCNFQKQILTAGFECSHLDKNLIITGPNASGKTTILKTTLINIILTQQMGCGFYSSGNLHPFKYIHCYLYFSHSGLECFPVLCKALRMVDFS